MHVVYGTPEPVLWSSDEEVLASSYDNASIIGASEVATVAICELRIANCPGRMVTLGYGSNRSSTNMDST